MTEKVDYSTLSMAALQTEQARLCAFAIDNGIELPNELQLDFETIETGIGICTDLAGRVNANQEAAQPVPSKKKPKAKAKAKKKKAKAKTGETAVKTKTKTQ